MNPQEKIEHEHCTTACDPTRKVLEPRFVQRLDFMRSSASSVHAGQVVQPL
jgi:hypothetical protein